MERWHSMPASEAIARLAADERNGLSDGEAAKRLEKYGRNFIESGKKVSALRLLAEQFASPLVLILVAAAAVSFAFDKGIDAALIIAIVILNGLFGFIQNYNAEKSIEALKRIGASKALVYRNGLPMEIRAEELVPGDIVLLREGTKVPADCRLLDSKSLAADESILTGESFPAKKSTGAVGAGAPVADMDCMIFKDTVIVRGSGKAIVVETGRWTQMGQIATTLEHIEEEPTRFSVETADLGSKIGKGILVLAVVIAGVVLFLHEAEPIDALIFSISLAVAAIPEGLPAVVTLSLALATRKMLRYNSLVRKLPVVENLGSVDIICTDKTGTMTENSMTVRAIYCNGQTYEVSGTGKATEGEFSSGGKKISAGGLHEILFCGLACNDTITASGLHGHEYSGDPTEIALVVSAAKAGIRLDGAKRVSEIPFSSEKKRMTVVFESDGKKIAYSKGAPEVIAESCSHILINGKKMPLSGNEREKILEANNQMASGALRVLGFAYKELRALKDNPEEKMAFLGLQGMIDPPRPEVAQAIKTAKEAGIRVMMLTGDNRLTAKAIAGKIGLEGSVVDGTQAEGFSEVEFDKAIMEADVFARMSPVQKFRILKRLKEKGYSVAMTGDGVNDAPALKQADVGIAMGIRGSDVAKESSDIVLLDDNFATIIEAVRQGRGVFDNIQKFVFFLLANNLAEVMIVFITAIAGYISLTPVMLLWINLVTDGLPALALGTDPPGHGIMKQPPRRKSEHIITRQQAKRMVVVSSIFTALILAIFFFYLPNGISMAQTMVFNGLVAFEILLVAVIKKQEGMSILENRWLLLALAVSVAIQLAVIYTPAAGLFGVLPLGILDWGVISAGALAAYMASNSVLQIMEKSATKSMQPAN